MPADKAAARKWLKEINAVLNRYWDPIGDCPEDEYEAYAGPLASMVHRGATDAQLLQYLEHAETELIGPGQPFDRPRGEKVIAAIRALKAP